MAYPNYTGQWPQYPSQVSPSATAYPSHPGFSAYGQNPYGISQALSTAHPGFAAGQPATYPGFAAHPGFAAGQQAAHPGFAAGQPAAHGYNPYMVQNPGYPGQAAVHPGMAVGTHTLGNPAAPGTSEFPGPVSVQRGSTLQRATTLPRPSVLPETGTATRPPGLRRTLIVPESSTSQGAPQFQAASTLPRTTSSSVYAPMQQTSVPAASQVPTQPPQTYVPTTAQPPQAYVLPSPTTAQPPQTYVPHTTAQPPQAYGPPSPTTAQPPQAYITPTTAQPPQVYVTPTTAQPPQTYVPPAPTTAQPPQAYVPPAPTTVQPPQAYVPPSPTTAQPPQAHVPPSPTTAQPEPSYQGPLPGGQYPNTPLGIKNNGENICFMNSILQCLSHSPGLVPGLTKDKKKFRGTSAMVSFGNAATELMEHLAVLPSLSYGSGAVANPDAVRAAASALPGTMVAHPKRPQEQQDAAEFLMWLFDALHSVLKAGSVVTKGKTSGTGQTIDRLKTLRFIYGEESPQRINEMKEIAKKEIERAGGLDVGGYAEAVQRLADLEWLTYKKAEQSHVDDLFTGQHIEAFNCTNCSRMSINIQTFKILPVPVGQPGQPYAVLQLDDCFSSFGTVENLSGLKCQCSNRMDDDRYGQGHDQGQPELYAGTANGSQTLQGLAQLKHAGLGVKRRPQLSENTFKSPRGARIKAGPPSNSPTPSVKLTDGQRRSLLRQLPECLVIQLMRFSHSAGRQVKLHHTVKLPLTGLDLTPYIIDTVMQRPDVTASSTVHRYDLYALCLHIGADMTALGHYIAYCQSQNGVWYRYDDAQVAPVNIEYELNTRLVCENVYLAFYRRSHTAI